MPLRESASAGDIGYLLRDLNHTPLRFSLEPSSPRALDGVDDAEKLVASYVRDHSGATLNDVRTNVPQLGGLPYEQARSIVVRLVDADVLRINGQVPLEEVDGRYERVATCNLCGAPSERHPTLFWKYNTPVVRCTACGLLYANPRWKAEHLFGRYTDDYWELYADKVSHTALDAESNMARWEPFLRDLEPARNTGRLLDVGCATGEFLVAAKALGWEVYGVETSPIAAQQAAKLSGANIHTGSLETAPYPDGWFDAVTLWDVIEHLQDPRAYVELIARKLRNDGMFALATPNIRSLAYRLLGRDWTAVGPNDHIYYFAPRTLSRLLTSSGFAIHDMVTTATEVPVWERWLRRPKLQRLAPRLRNAAVPITTRFLWGDELYVFARKRSE